MDRRKDPDVVTTEMKTALFLLAGCRELLHLLNDMPPRQRRSRLTAAQARAFCALWNEWSANAPLAGRGAAGREYRRVVRESVGESLDSLGSALEAELAGAARVLVRAFRNLPRPANVREVDRFIRLLDAAVNTSRSIAQAREAFDRLGLLLGRAAGRGGPESPPRTQGDIEEIKGGILRLARATAHMERGQETLSCDLIRLAETVECIADDAAGPESCDALTVEQCAATAHVPISMIRRVIKRGELKGKQVRRRGTGVEYRVLSQDLQAWLARSDAPEQPAAKSSPSGKPRRPKPPLPNYLGR